MTSADSDVEQMGTVRWSFRSVLTGSIYRSDGIGAVSEQVAMGVQLDGFGADCEPRGVCLKRTQSICQVRTPAAALPPCAAANATDRHCHPCHTAAVSALSPPPPLPPPSALTPPHRIPPPPKTAAALTRPTLTTRPLPARYLSCTARGRDPRRDLHRHFSQAP